MNRKILNTVIACVAFVAVTLGLTVNKVLAPAPLTNEQLSENGLFVYDLPRRIQDFTLIDQNNNEISKNLLRGQWTLIFFGYTFCPDICPLTMANMTQFARLLEQESDLAADTQIMMVSVDPQRDTPEVLAGYIDFFNKDFIGATGEFIDIFNLASQLNVAFSYTPGTSAKTGEVPGEGPDSDYLVSHSGQIALINPNGDYHGFFKVPHDPQQMFANYEILRARYE